MTTVAEPKRLPAPSAPAGAGEVPVLIVDDNPGKRLALTSVLAPLGYQIVEAESGLEALRCLMKQDFAVILLDVRMPLMDGFETAHMIRQRKQSELTPIIFITAYGSEAIANITAYSTGAADFIFSPVVPAELRAKVSVFANLYLRAQKLALEAAKVKRAADHLALLTDANPVGIYRLDADSHYTYVNRRWCAVTGLTHEEAIGQPWNVFVAPDHRADLPATLGSDEPTASDWYSQRFDLVRHGDPAIVEVTGKAVLDGDGHFVDWIGTLSDVTADEVARASVVAARDAALAANLMQNNFAASASHELKTPTASVLGFIEEVLDNEGLSDDDRRCLEVAYRNAQRLSRLIDDLLILNENEISASMMRIEPTAMVPVVEQVLSSFSAAAQRASVQLVRDPSAEPASALVDPLRLEQALNNLVSNGLKFTPPGGQVSVGVRSVGDTVEISVVDTGIGIEPESFAAIFGRFYRGKGAVDLGSKGSGLGLAIAKGMIEAQKGSISVSSAVGQGSTFTISVPAASRYAVR